MHLNYPKNTPLVKLPKNIEFTVFLIREELKSRKLMIDLNKLGIDSSIFISDFSSFIFSSIGFDNDTDEFYEWYLNQLDKFCQNINQSDGLKLTNEAFNFYIHLRVQKELQTNKKSPIQKE